MSDASIRGGEGGEVGGGHLPGEPVPDDAAVVDRIVDGRHAVLLVGEAEVELHVEVALLPEGTVEGDWLRIDLRSDPDRTAARRAAIEGRMDRIRRDRGGGRFG